MYGPENIEMRDFQDEDENKLVIAVGHLEDTYRNSNKFGPDSKGEHEGNNFSKNSRISNDISSGEIASEW